MKKCVKCKLRKTFLLKAFLQTGANKDDQWICIDCLRKELDKGGKKVE